MNRKEDDLVGKLKPFWNEYCEEYSLFLKKVKEIEKKMNEEVDEGLELEFIGSTEGFCGIGAKDFSKRESFDLIPDSDLSR